MPDNQAIIQVLYTTQGVENLKAANTELAKSDTVAKTVTNTMGRQGEVLGMTRREFSRTGSEAVMALNLIGGKAVEANAALAGGVRAATELGRAFMFGGGASIAVVGVALALDALMTALDKTTPEMKEFSKQISELAKGDQAVKGLAQLSGVTEDEAKKALEAAKQNSNFAERLKELSAEASKSIDPLNGLKDALGDLGKNMLAHSGYIQGIVAAWNILIPQTTAATEQQKKLQSTIKESAIEEDRAGMAKLRAENSEFLLKRAQDEREKSMKAAEKTQEDYTKALQHAADAQQNLLKGMIEKAAAPTAVTDLDIEATKLGKYTDKWDEFRRRLEAVAGGTSPEAYGAKFAAMFKSLGMGAKEAAEAFKDWSLFADPKNMKLIDMGAIIANVENQIKQMIGKANVMKEAMKQVWKNLTPQEKVTLKQLGIDTLSDAEKSLLGQKPIALDVKAAETLQDNAKKVGKMIQEMLPSSIKIDLEYVPAGSSGGSPMSGGKPTATPPGKSPTTPPRPGVTQTHDSSGGGAPPVIVNANVNNSVDVNMLAFQIANIIQQRRAQ